MTADRSVFDALVDVVSEDPTYREKVELSLPFDAAEAAVDALLAALPDVWPAQRAGYASETYADGYQDGWEDAVEKLAALVAEEES